MAVWKVSNDPTFPLAELLVGHDERTRGAALNLKKASTYGVWPPRTWQMPGVHHRTFVTHKL
ncbi:Hypothetical protein FKW44_005388 [Caligus rogercresseyi]|uniref:Uncharacterized protein n=1 Tax=Caligus rogercresseyi TaxID=217165 RepID=A0A7T8KBV7_CALRO|nr:Hypothetical protein FKW44_005388 [Caligus rogercresseyi]